jgi:RNA recognition motif-containing protein
MTNDEDAPKAIEMWDGKEIDGRAVRVSEAKPMEDRGPRNGGGRFQKKSW